MNYRHALRIFSIFFFVSVFFGLAVFTVYGEGFPKNTISFLLYKGEGTAADATAYLDNLNAPATFNAWKDVYEFDQPTGNVRAVYYNGADLGLTRDMNCRDNYVSGATGNIACYVSNHGLSPAGPILVGMSDGINDVNTVATVAMVWDASKVVDNEAVSFYVYDGNGNPMEQLALDLEGPKNVPHLCIACHGGNYDSTKDVVKGANFLPWDPFTFDFVDAEGWRLEEQQESFRAMNDMVIQTTPADAIQEFINESYSKTGGVAQPGSVMTDDYIPDGWTDTPGEIELYNEVIKHDCRTCHVAQSPAMTDYEDIKYSTGAPLSSFYMPHAELTFKNFWRSTRAATFARLTQADNNRTFVVTRLDDPLPGSCDVGNCSLREAVIAANTETIASGPAYITFGIDGTFVMQRSGAEENVAATGDYDLTRTDRPIYILGNGYDKTVISAENLDRIFQITAGVEARIQHLSLVNGNIATGYGGAIFNTGDLEIHDLAIYNNHANVAGGGIYNGFGGELDMVRTTIRDNSADNNGGGITTEGSTTSIQHSTIYANTAYWGGGIRTTHASDAITLTNVTVAGNIGGGAGGILVSNASASVNFQATILADNVSTTGGAANDCNGTITSLAFNIIESTTNCTINNQSSDDQIGVDPKLESLTYLEGSTGVLPLATGSLAIDAIPLSSAYCSSWDRDQRNVVRPQRINCDIGAVEKIECDRDEFGYEMCPIVHNFEDISAGSTTLPLTGATGDNAFFNVSLPFTMPFYGEFYDEIFVGSNGILTFESGSIEHAARPLPDASAPHQLIAAWWDDLAPNAYSKILTKQIGDKFVVEYFQVPDKTERNYLTFQIHLYSNGDIEIHHGKSGDLNAGREHTVGIQNGDGSIGLNYFQGNSSAYHIPDGIRFTYAPSRVHVNENIDDELAGYWTFDEEEGNQYFDMSGNDNHAERGNSAAEYWIGGTPPVIQFDNPASTYFDGSQYIVAPDSSSLDVEDAVTVAAWVSIDTAVLDQKIVSKAYVGGSSSSRGFVLGVLDGQLKPEVFAANGSSYSFVAGLIPTYEWTHVAFTYQPNGEMIGYINGERVFAVDAGSAKIGTNSESLVIGAASWNPSQHRMQGAIDDVRVYERALSATEIGRIASGYGCETRGNSWDTAHHSLQCALSDANVSDSNVEEIFVADGTYTPSSNREVGFHVGKDDLSIVGGYAGSVDNARDIAANPTILSGDIDGNDSGDVPTGHNSRGILVNFASKFRVDGVTISGGLADGSAPYNQGGGFVNIGDSAMLVNSRLTGNSAKQGGAVASGYGTLTISNTLVASNTATSSNGGAIFLLNGDLELHTSAINDNSAFASGGGLFVDFNAGSFVTVTRSSMMRNHADTAGAMLIQDSTLYSVNSSYLDNTATGQASSLYLAYTNSTLLYNTISNRLPAIPATFVGVQVLEGSLDTTATVFDDHCLLEDEPLFATGGYNFANSTSCGFAPGAGTDKVNTFYTLGDDKTGTLTTWRVPGPELRDEVPLNSAGCGTTITIDQRGAPRPAGAAVGCDVGAGEWASAPTAVALFDNATHVAAPRAVTVALLMTTVTISFYLSKRSRMISD